MKERQSYIHQSLDTGPLTLSNAYQSSTTDKAPNSTEGLQSTLAEIVALIRNKHCQFSVNKEVPSTDSSCWDHTITVHYNALAQSTIQQYHAYIFYYPCMIYPWHFTYLYVKWLFHVGTGCFQHFTGDKISSLYTILHIANFVVQLWIKHNKIYVVI